MEKEASNVCKRPVYDNIALVGINGVLLASVSRRHLRFYLKHDLVDKIDNYPGFDEAYKLKFKHENIGRERFAGKIKPRQNICVECGTKEELTKHHVVPYFIKRVLPDVYKERTDSWVVPMCRACHAEIEKINNTLIESYHTTISDYDAHCRRVKFFCHKLGLDEAKVKWHEHFEKFKDSWLREWVELNYADDYLELFRYYEHMFRKHMELTYLDNEIFLKPRPEWD